MTDWAARVVFGLAATAGLTAVMISAHSLASSLIIDKIDVDPSVTAVTVRGVEDENHTTDTWVVRAVARCGP